MPTLTTEQVIHNATQLTQLANEPLPGRLALRIRKMLHAYEPIIKAYEETRKSLIDQYAIRDDAGSIIAQDGMVKINDIEAFNTQIRETVTEEHSLPAIPIEEAMLESISITVAQIEALMALGEEESCSKD